ncbi:hypothetical protein KF707_10415 [Candidatus Obscuribacterales bacterium]|nr:hypothetical protein [Candidatus Obscuribacterales bacterium]
MHDCPTCRVPLHGHEEVCPSCGTRQRVSKSYSGLLKGQPKKPPVNMLPFVVAFFALGVGGFVLMKSSWIGKLMARGPVQVDPMDKLSWLEARQMLYSKIDERLKSVGSTGEYTWTSGGNPADINAPGPVELNVKTELADPNSRRQIMDPAKEFMYKAQVPSVVMNDTKTNATWTYSVQAPAVAPAGGAAGGGSEEAPPEE